MALKIRLQKKGARNAPLYTVVVAESASRRDGRFVEIVGNYNPRARGKDVEYKLNLERIDYWRSVGAKPSETVNTLIKKAQKTVAK
ncbi:MAG: 30S ribosomal protein S16 [Verrucomicrobia bacterium GWF2_51_19]|nr:MAG: 30S ribosomal protein S16 [Verrucomicrobia bacterium GWF2_51_19]HCJ12320.1 30S ribosomal protein S16 [Opitutae bacterium]